ncbi:MAG: GNAT family N-acetyltransferase [Clostridiales bacterium]|nr:GNAT family N-acetyltransferase [Clostridiales bacterium]
MIKYEILKNPKNITLDQMEKLNLNCFPEEPYNNTLFTEMLKLHYWIVVARNTPIGFAYVNMLEGQVHISRIAISNEYRRNNIGQKLLEEIIEFSSKIGSNKITLSVKENNMPAIKLYQKYHFKKSGEKHQFIIAVGEVIKKIKNNSITAVNLSNDYESNEHRYDIRFVLESGEVIGACQLDANFPGCSNYYLENASDHLDESLASLVEYLSPDCNTFKIIFSDQKLMKTCKDNGYKLIYSLSKMVRHTYN